MEFKDLSPEQGEKAKACTTPADMLRLAKEEDYELSADELDAVSGGGWLCDGHTCDDYVHDVHT